MTLRVPLAHNTQVIICKRDYKSCLRRGRNFFEANGLHKVVCSQKITIQKQTWFLLLFELHLLCKDLLFFASDLSISPAMQGSFVLCKRSFNLSCSNCIEVAKISKPVTFKRSFALKRSQSKSNLLLSASHLPNLSCHLSIGLSSERIYNLVSPWYQEQPHLPWQGQSETQAKNLGRSWQEDIQPRREGRYSTQWWGKSRSGQGRWPSKRSASTRRVQNCWLRGAPFRDSWERLPLEYPNYLAMDPMINGRTSGSQAMPCSPFKRPPKVTSTVYLQIPTCVASTQSEWPSCQRTFS